MNKEELQKKHCAAIEDAEYEEIKHSAIYKLDFDKAAASCTTITLQAMIDENKSILEMAKLHMDERAVTVLNQRIFNLETILNQSQK